MSEKLLQRHFKIYILYKNQDKISKFKIFLLKSTGNRASASVETQYPLNPFLMAMSFEKFCHKAHHNVSL